MTEQKMTRFQKRVYDYIAEFQAENKYTPSLEEISAGLGKSVGCISQHINNLEGAGHLRRVARRVIVLN